jgi:hypothetical protein
MLDLRQIQYFVCVYEEGSFTRAARNVVQPALSILRLVLSRHITRRTPPPNTRPLWPRAASDRNIQQVASRPLKALLRAELR